MKHRISLVAIALVTLILTGCAGPGSIPEESFYRLPPAPRAERLPRPVIDGVLGVPRLRAEGLYHERAILHVSSSRPLDIRPYHYYAWAEAPAVMMRDNLVDYLRSRGAATQIVRYQREGEAELRLYGRVVRFERIVSTEGAAAQVTLEFSLERGRSTIMPVRRYEARVAATDLSMDATAGAFGQALYRIYADLLDDLATAAGR